MPWYVESGGGDMFGGRLRWDVGHEIVNASVGVIDRLIPSCHDSSSGCVPVDE